MTRFMDERNIMALSIFRRQVIDKWGTSSYSILLLCISVRRRIVKWGPRRRGFCFPTGLLFLYHLSVVRCWWWLSVGSVGGSCLFLLVVGFRLLIADCRLPGVAVWLLLLIPCCRYITGCRVLVVDCLYRSSLSFSIVGAQLWSHNISLLTCHILE
jgi:hypothetical protein